MKRILIIDNDHNLCMLLQRYLTKNGFEVCTACSANEGITKFKEEIFDLVICDYRLDGKNGRDILQTIKALKPETVFIMITSYSDVRIAVAMIKEGAYDYISKPLIPDELLKVIHKALQKDNQLHSPRVHLNVVGTNGNGKHNGTLKPALPVINSNDDMVMGDTAQISELFKQMDLVASTNYSVIIYGDSGTGKEVMARAIHNKSSRCNHPFIALDCGTLTKELAGSELFGHVKGSFTGSVGEKEGHFEMADGGTLFLDEVGNLSIDVQASLLRVLQERKFKRVGGSQEITVDIRILVASNANLQEGCRTGKFREDLYHRLNEFSVTMPPLRNRKKDIPVFADYFLAKVNKELKKNVQGFDKKVMEMFMKYHWPGNLREMMNVIRRMTLLTKSSIIAAKMLPQEISEMAVFSGQLRTPVHHGNGVAILKDVASRAEGEKIVAVLKEVHFNKTRAAKMLRIDRKTLYNKLREYAPAAAQA